VSEPTGSSCFLHLHKLAPSFFTRTHSCGGQSGQPHCGRPARAFRGRALREHGDGLAVPPLLSFPSLRLHHTVGEKEHEHHTGQIVDEVFGVHETASQAIEMLDE